MMNGYSDISVIILTYNEELHIARCINNLKDLVKNIFVIDSYSTDNTVALAESMGAKIYFNTWKNYATQFQWALDHCPIDTQWVMRLDADEYLESALIEEIRFKLPFLTENISGVNLKRKYIFMGKLIRHGDRYPLILLRLWRHGQAKIEQRWMDEHMVLLTGQSALFSEYFVDNNLNTISWFVDKHNKYANREMIDIIFTKYKLGSFNSSVFDNSFQASLRRFIKCNIYNKLPLFFRPVCYFIYRYFFRLGFLDGAIGFSYHFMQGLWYRLLVDLKCFEAEQAIKNLASKDEMIDKLSTLTGLSLK